MTESGDPRGSPFFVTGAALGDWSPLRVAGLRFGRRVALRGGRAAFFFARRVGYHPDMPRTEIDIRLNGQPARVARATTVQALLEGLGALGPGLAVAVNEEVVRRAHYAEIVLQPDDRVEVIQAVGGG